MKPIDEKNPIGAFVKKVKRVKSTKDGFSSVETTTTGPVAAEPFVTPDPTIVAPAVAAEPTVITPTPTNVGPEPSTVNPSGGLPTEDEDEDEIFRKTDRIVKIVIWLTVIVVVAIAVWLGFTYWPKGEGKPAGTTAAVTTTETAAVTTTSETTIAETTAPAETTAAETTTAETTAAPLTVEDKVVNDLTVNVGWKLGDFAVGDDIKRELDKSTTGNGALNLEGFRTPEEVVAFLGSGTDEANAILADLFATTGASREEILDPNNWVAIQALVPFSYPGNSGYIKNTLTSLGKRSGNTNDIFMAFVAPRTDLVVYFRGACANPQIVPPVPDKLTPTPTPGPTATPTPTTAPTPTPTPTPGPTATPTPTTAPTPTPTAAPTPTPTAAPTPTPTPAPKSPDPTDYKQPGDGTERDSGTGTMPTSPTVTTPAEVTPPSVDTTPTSAPYVAPAATPIPTTATPTPVPVLANPWL